ncbi:DegT/DnrJ/EryC1/StrS family aminotransferase [uncultured Hoeflea sp.]|uniref:DegT/DnrJ/EryC1/StrS family aminotransferase n=1 Tax=uncultured Hoeflea sp. TaxID=538666 RepID=UPI0026134433|nr:DegT/DnrJ/EryC1/StrS family aminotransferase [uncultured Hoeflea sp.]
MIPRLRPAIGAADIAAAFKGGKSVEEFERTFATLMGQSHAIAFPYGRTAQMVLMEAMELKGREIILPAYTCVVVAHAIVLSGCKPVFVDSETDGFNMDLDKAEAAITANTGAIIATSIHGYPVDLDRLDAIAARHPHVEIIQDCAHSFAAEWHGRPVQKHGRAAIFGLNISKLMTSIFGGMITTDDADLAERLRALRDHRLEGGGRGVSRAFYLGAAATALAPPVFTLVKRIADLGLIDRFVRYYDETLIDMPANHLVQIGRAEASVGVRQCAAYCGIIDRRRRIAAFYDQALADALPDARPPLVDGATYSHYVLRVADPEGLVSAAARRGIELGRLIDYCVPDMMAYRDMASTQGPFDQTRRLNASVVNLPVWVNKTQARRVVETLHAIT